VNSRLEVWGSKSVSAAKTRSAAAQAVSTCSASWDGEGGQHVVAAPAHLPPDEAGRAQLLEMLGDSRMLTYASDFPHDHGDSIASLLAQLSSADRHGVVHVTAAAFHGLKPLRTYTST